MPAGKVVNAAILVGTVLVLMNLERTFRSAVGTMQWRIKFLILGLAVIFGARIYTRSQALVYSGHNNSLTEVEAIGLLVGCALLGAGYFRSGFREIDVYPSRAVLQTSITVSLVGGYLFVIGVLAQIVAQLRRRNVFPAPGFPGSGRHCPARSLSALGKNPAANKAFRQSPFQSATIRFSQDLDPIYPINIERD